MDGSGHIRKGGSVDATRLLEQDHQNVEQLFVQFEQATGETEAKGEIVEQIIRELSIHAAIEEEVFYPAVREAVGDEGMVDHAIDEHQEVKTLLNDLDKMSPSDPGYHQKVEAVISDVREHVQEEEGEMFPRFRETISEQQLTEIGSKLEQAKGRAPTRPHPKAPSEPPGNKVVGAPTAMIDRAKDKLQDREGA